MVAALGGVRRLRMSPVKSAFTTFLALATFSSLACAQNTEPPIADTIKGWRTVRIVLRIDGGDYDPPAPFILLQRLDSDRIILSTGEDTSGAEYLPVARSIIAPDAAQKLIERAVGYYSQAQKEIGEKARVRALPRVERDAIYAKAGFGISAAYIRIEVLGPNRSHQYEDDFADRSAVLNEFSSFIMQQHAQPK